MPQPLRRRILPVHHGCVVGLGFFLSLFPSSPPRPCSIALLASVGREVAPPVLAPPVPVPPVLVEFFKMSPIACPASPPSFLLRSWVILPSCLSTCAPILAFTMLVMSFTLRLSTWRSSGGS